MFCGSGGWKGRLCKSGGCGGLWRHRIPGSISQSDSQSVSQALVSQLVKHSVCQSASQLPSQVPAAFRPVIRYIGSLCHGSKPCLGPIGFPSWKLPPPPCAYYWYDAFRFLKLSRLLKDVFEETIEVPLPVMASAVFISRSSSLFKPEFFQNHWNHLR